MNTEKRDILSISGYFIERHSPRQAQYFGGFLSMATSPDAPRTNVFAMPFTGALVDCYGLSQIEGEMSPVEMAFNKKYNGRQHYIAYEFKKNDKGIWVGGYTGHESIGTGYAMAKTNLDWPGVNMVLRQPMDPETRAAGLVEQMVVDGLLKIRKDRRTGQHVVVPCNLEKRVSSHAKRAKK